jgi:hypothetical protein
MGASETAYLVLAPPVLPAQTNPAVTADPVPSAPPPPPFSPVPAAPKLAASPAPPPLPPENLRPLSQPPSPCFFCGIFKMDLAILLSGFGLMTIGYADNVSPGFQVGAELRSAKDENDLFRLSLEIRGLLPSTVTARTSTVEGETGPVDRSRWRTRDLSQVTALLVPCLRWKYFLGCAAFEGGAIFSQEKLGLDTHFTWGIGPRLGLDVPLSQRLSVRAFGEAIFIPGPVGFYDDNPISPGTKALNNVFWEQSVVSGFVGIGMSVKFE